MNTFRFKKVVFPVIHVEDYDQACRNIDIALNADADGVFIINHAIFPEELISLYEKLRKNYPDAWIGLSILGKTSLDAMQMVPLSANGLWTDNACVNELQDNQPMVEEIWNLKKSRGWNGMYFGGIAFKYQKPVSDLSLAVTKARDYVDVVCTSGAGTGIVADVEKIRTMSAAADGFPLAIASGVSLLNVQDYLPYIDYFLVATGISTTFTEFDPGRVKTLVERIHGYQR